MQLRSLLGAPGRARTIEDFREVPLVLVIVHAEGARIAKGEIRVLALAQVDRVSDGETRLPVFVELWSWSSFYLIRGVVVVHAEDLLRIGKAKRLLIPIPERV